MPTFATSEILRAPPRLPRVCEHPSSIPGGSRGIPTGVILVEERHDGPGQMAHNLCGTCVLHPVLASSHRGSARAPAQHGHAAVSPRSRTGAATATVRDARGGTARGPRETPSRGPVPSTATA